MALSPRNLLTRSAIGSDVVAVGDLGALFSSRPAFVHGARAAELVPDPAPQSGDVYLTEDAGGPNGLLYRFRPLEQHGSYGSLRNGGFLQAMRCRKGTTHVPDLSVFDVPGTTLAVEWVPVPDPSAGSTPIRQQYADGEVTRSATCEGAWRGSRRIDDEAGHPMWHGGRDDRVHFACSFARRNDGSLVAHDGQVWAYDPDYQSLTLEVHLGVDRDRTRAGFEGPDRVTLSPHGGLILVEHGGAQHLLAADEDGSTSLFGRYRLPTSRLAGPTFSPDGSALFATIEDHGLTIAIRGPFRALARP